MVVGGCPTLGVSSFLDYGVDDRANRCLPCYILIHFTEELGDLGAVVGRATQESRSEGTNDR